MLKVTDLTAGYGKTNVLTGVSFDTEDGECVALVGGNGAGKSTVLRSIAGLITPRSGNVHFEGREITGWASHEIVKIGLVLVPEGRLLFPQMTVWENLVLGGSNLRAHSRKPELLAFVLDLFPRLKERIHQTAGTLSGGEQQMVALARGLMAAPKLLMLDEPSLGLAPLVVREIYRVLRRLSLTEGLSLLLVEQNVRMALSISSRGYVMENGKIILSGKSAMLLDEPAVKKAYLGI
jgi:branched-chain amino acid transport system ATP-binding protein